MAMLNFILVILAYSCLITAQHGGGFATTMGPVAFLWPPDREWGAAQDNTAPCGSAASVVNRTSFPLVNGQIALVAQDESWSIRVAISYSNDPATNNDFETVIAAARISEMDEGHMCYPIPNPDPTDNVQGGENATIQISYTSDFEEKQNQTFYACADISYVLVQDFTYQVPCFNATVDDFNVTEPSSSQPGMRTTGSDSAAQQTSKRDAEAQNHQSLSSGAIAGIVIGIIVGLATLLGLGLFAWRKKQQLKRLQAQNASVRNVKWEGSSAAVSDASDSLKSKEPDIMLSNLGK